MTADLRAHLKSVPNSPEVSPVSKASNASSVKSTKKHNSCIVFGALFLLCVIGIFAWSCGYFGNSKDVNNSSLNGSSVGSAESSLPSSVTANSKPLISSNENSSTLPTQGVSGSGPSVDSSLPSSTASQNSPNVSSNISMPILHSKAVSVSFDLPGTSVHSIPQIQHVFENKVPIVSSLSFTNDEGKINSPEGKKRKRSVTLAPEPIIELISVDNDSYTDISEVDDKDSSVFTGESNNEKSDNSPVKDFHIEFDSGDDLFRRLVEKKDVSELVEYFLGKTSLVMKKHNAEKHFFEVVFDHISSMTNKLNDLYDEISLSDVSEGEKRALLLSKRIVQTAVETKDVLLTPVSFPNFPILNNYYNSWMLLPMAEKAADLLLAKSIVGVDEISKNYSIIDNIVNVWNFIIENTHESSESVGCFVDNKTRNKKYKYELSKPLNAEDVTNIKTNFKVKTRFDDAAGYIIDPYLYGHVKARPTFNYIVNYFKDKNLFKYAVNPSYTVQLLSEAESQARVNPFIKKAALGEKITEFISELENINPGKTEDLYAYFLNFFTVLIDRFDDRSSKPQLDRNLLEKILVNRSKDDQIKIMETFESIVDTLNRLIVETVTRLRKGPFDGNSVEKAIVESFKQNELLLHYSTTDFPKNHKKHLLTLIEIVIDNIAYSLENLDDGGVDLFKMDSGIILRNKVFESLYSERN